MRGVPNVHVCNSLLYLLYYVRIFTILCMYIYYTMYCSSTAHELLLNVTACIAIYLQKIFQLLHVAYNMAQCTTGAAATLTLDP